MQRVAEHIGTQHHSIEVGTDERDLPGSGEIETSLYLLFKEMKQDATVVLSGESANKVFSGYPWFQQEEFLEAKQFPWLLHHSYITSILSKAQNHLYMSS